MLTVFKVNKLALWKKYTVSIKSCCKFKKISQCFVKCYGRVRELLSYLENPRKIFLLFDLQKKNFVKHIENLSQHLPKVIMGNNVSITDIALRHYNLSIIGIAPVFFGIIDYRFRTGRFIVPITDYIRISQ